MGTGWLLTAYTGASPKAMALSSVDVGVVIHVQWRVSWRAESGSSVAVEEWPSCAAGLVFGLCVVVPVAVGRSRARRGQSDSGRGAVVGVDVARQLLSKFGFPAARWQDEVAKLSGGERRRLQLLACLAARPNVLVLDEPTNDLDIATLAVLEEYLDL